MTNWTIWFLLAGIVVILELFTGTFYLLMISLGLAAGGIAALVGVDWVVQSIVGAVVGMTATYTLRRSRWGKIQKLDAARDPNVNLDIGQVLMINGWNDNAGVYTARTAYRGAMWDVDLKPQARAEPGMFTIVEIRGSRLIVTNHVSGNR